METKGQGAYAGYRIAIEGETDDMTRTGRATPGGEYLRRFWHPVAYEDEVADTPMRVRILGEDLVVFRDRSGAYGLLHLHCSHRGASLEYGRVEEHGIRCCYHGRVFDVDGTLLEMPGEHDAERLCRQYRQGAYPTHVFGGMVFAYLGPIERRPPFPVYDKYDIPGMRLVHGPRVPFACNWVQVKENAMDPAHTAILHAWEGMFAAEFGKFPEITWGETPVGMAYVAARRVGDKVWLRSTDIMMPSIHSLTSVFEDGKTEKDCSPPWLTIWTTPVDDHSCVNFYLCHVAVDDPTPDEVRNRAMLTNGGQTAMRPYAERQKVPGDYDAITSQGELPSHSLEQLGSLDAGVVMFRRMLKRGIRDVQEGREPHGMIRDTDVHATFASDRVLPISAVTGDPEQPENLMALARATREAYLAVPPLSRGAVPPPPPVPARRYTFKDQPAEVSQ
jgi:phenylpropionate dioxygenase-like ring-hydroxylating dioxygenase large terminal subunit